MRSILAFLILTIITISVPASIMGLANALNLSDIGIIISQALVIIIFVLIFTNLLKYLRKYERDTLEAIDMQNDLDKLRDLREKRKTYKSKANITAKILSLDFTNEEAQKLKKYATDPEDMEHYYASLINNSPKEERELYRQKRDYFEKRFGKKSKVYPDFKENLTTSIKRTVFFFLIAIINSMLPERVKDNQIILYTVLILGMFFLAVIMINTIIWIVRALRSYWNKDVI